MSFQFTKTQGYTIHWKIENLDKSLLQYRERLDSPTFVADTMEGTKWFLRLYHKGYSDENFVGVFLCRDVDCSGPVKIEVNFEIVFRLKEGTILKKTNLLGYSFKKNRSFGFAECLDRCKILYFEEGLIITKNLMVECTMWKKGESLFNHTHLYARTTFTEEQRSFVWIIDKFKILHSKMSKELKDDLIDFDLCLNEKQLLINIKSINESIKYFSVKSTIKHPSKNVIYSTTDSYFSNDLKNGKLSCPRLFDFLTGGNITMNDLLLEFQYEIPIKTVSYESYDFFTKPPKLAINVVENIKDETHNTSMLAKDLKYLYNDATFSDIELRISTKTFKAHKNILSARSPVFRSMFSNDMEEKNLGYINITDFEEDTVHRMLLYIYTDSLESLQFESASNLYAIADKYDIMSLKSRCSSFFKETLCPENACDVLVLSDLHNDFDLKNAIQDYILKQDKTFFISPRYKCFMDNNLKLAADLMYKNIFKE